MLDNNEYVVAMSDGAVKTVPSLSSDSFNVNDVVRVTVAQNDPKNCYIIGKPNITKGSSGGGSVDSVNGQTGVVVLDADDISDASTTNKFVTDADKAKLSNLSGTNTGDQDLTSIILGLDSKYEIELLTNVDFTNPVAQAGIGGMHGSVAYAVDRWKLISGTVSADSNGLTLSGTIRQILENSIGFPVFPSIEMYSGTATITYDNSTKYCDITSSGGTIMRPHLGLREITDWAKIPVADRGIVLQKCQRFFTPVGGRFIGNSYGTSFFAYIPIPTSFRSDPAITTHNLGTILLSTGSIYNPESAIILNTSSNGITLNLTSSSDHGTVVGTLTDFSADLLSDL